MLLRRLLSIDRMPYLFAILLVTMSCATMLMGCAPTSGESFESRLAAMSDDELISYYRGINDRLKAIQAGTREADRQGTFAQNDYIAKMPYIIGGEAWQLEQKQAKVKKELNRRNIMP